MASQYFKGTPQKYKSPLLINTTLYLASTYDLFSLPSLSGADYEDQTIEIYKNGQNKPIYTVTISGWGGVSYKFDSIGIFKITHKCKYSYTGFGEEAIRSYPTISFNFNVVENKLPLKPWTMTDVINRLLDVCEPIRQGEKPRFRLNGMGEDGKIISEGQEGAGQAAKFDKIPAPQFSFTRQTLRECLQEAGKVIHGEPRLRIKKDGAGKYYYEVIYDLYASQEETDIYYKPYASKGLEWVVNNYQTWIDTNAENLVNQLDKLGGVIVEPYSGGAKSVRTENQYVRITDENMLISTQYPIYTVDKFCCFLI